MNNPSLPAPSPDEARASLAEIDRLVERTRKTIAYGGAAPIMILWGIIWGIGFIAAQLKFGRLDRLWGTLDVVGLALTFLFVFRDRNARVKSPHAGRILFSWLLLIAFGFLWWGLLTSWRCDNLQQLRGLIAFWCTASMFGYVIMGLWLGRFYLWLGLAITAATLAGYWYLPAYFYLWMAIFGGGALIAAGVYALKFWR